MVKIIASDYKNNNHQRHAIVSDCYTDETDRGKFVIKSGQINYLSQNQFTTCTIEQLDLGDCHGSKKADDLVITKVFTPSLNFTLSESEKFSKTNLLTKSKEFTRSGDFSTLAPSSGFTASNDFPIDRGANLGTDKKKNQGTIIGTSVGAVAAVIIAAVAFFLIKKHKSLNINDGAVVIGGNETEVTVGNNLVSR